MVIVGSLDAFFDFEPGKLAIIRDWSSKDGGNSSVMRLPAGRAPHLVDNFEAAPLEKRRLYSNEQVYLTRESRLPIGLLARTLVSGFQSHDVAAFSRQSCQIREVAGGGARRRFHWPSATA